VNRQESDIISVLIKDSGVNQRMLAKVTGHSLGVVNRSIKSLTKAGYLSEQGTITTKTQKLIADKAPRKAIILAAGFGMRMAPLDTEIAKGLIEVQEETLIERQISQLHEVGIREIYIVVGFMKEQYEYLIDEYDVTLVVNPDYATKGNLHSLKLVKQHLENAYIIPCDTWSANNPYSELELYSWYMVSDAIDSKSSMRVNRKWELVMTSGDESGNCIIGICYLLQHDAKLLQERMEQLCQRTRYDGAYWEEALYDKQKMDIYARVVKASEVVEINTYEQLCEMESNFSQFDEAIAVIEETFNVKKTEIRNITILKKGITNRFFTFECKCEKYIIRIPGIGSQQLISREQEVKTYAAIAGKGICDDLIYANSETGYNIVKWIKDARGCNPQDNEDVKKCMESLRTFHNMKIVVDNEFDIFGQIRFYESLWGEKASVYRDYEKTKENIFSLKDYIEENTKEKILTHMDAVADNFLLYVDEAGDEQVQIIDWEYAAMQDPHVDIAMFAVDALYNKEQVDFLIQTYFEDKCTDAIRLKIYCYIAVGGLMWSNWCEFKRNTGTDFGEYSLRQYRYAKEYYRMVKKALEDKRYGK